MDNDCKKRDKIKKFNYRIIQALNNKKKRKNKTITKYKEIKSTNFLKVQQEYQFLIRVKVIKNIMKFSYLFILYTSYL